MKCSICGEVCSPNQAFCPKCGSAISVVPDFNLIEAELANSVGEVMDSEGEEANVNDSALEPDMYGETRTDLNAVKKSDSLNRFDDEDSDDDSDDDSDYDTSDILDDDIEYIKHIRDAKRQAAEKKKKRIIFICIIAAAVVAVLIISLVLLNKSKSGFDSHFNQASIYLEEKKYDKAVKELQNAIEAADSLDEKIKAREALYATYELIGNVDNATMLALINELIDLNPNEAKYKEWLLKYAKDIPKSNIASGTYDDVITVILTADASEIRYTIDGSKPNKNSALYTEPIVLSEEGTVVLKAISFTGDKVSEIAEYTYIISFASVDAPLISPDGGTYTENTKITISAPEGTTVYYTYDGSTPDENSTQYTEAVDMIRGNNVFSAIAISANGVKSKVVSNVYNLTVDANYTYNDAENKLINKLLSDGIITDTQGSDGRGGKYSFSYTKTANLKGNEYYIITTSHSDANGSTTGTYYYGVNTANGNVVELTKSGSDFTVS